MRQSRWALPRTTLPVAGLILNAFIWGLSWWPLRWLHSAGLHPLWTTAFTFSVVLVAVSLYQPAVWTRFLTTPALWLLALVSGLTNVAFNWAATTGDVVRVVLLFYLMPAWAMLFARWLLKEKITLQGLMRLGLAVIGVLFVLKRPESPWPLPSSLSDWLALAGGAMFALTNVLIVRLDKATDTQRVFAMFAGGAVTALLVAGFGVLWHVVTPPPASSWVLVFAVLAMGVFYLIGNLSMQFGAARLASSTTSLVMLVEIIFASLSAIWLGAAVLELRVLWGAILILCAAAWAALS